MAKAQNHDANTSAYHPPAPELEPLAQDPLSASDSAIYNRLAEKMSHIHNGFRSTWKMLQTACSAPASQITDSECQMDDTELLMTALSFVEGLSNHHAIEEKFIFPALASRMHEFSHSGVLIDQHELIHDGLIRIKAYLRGCEKFLDEEIDDDGGRVGEGLDRGKLRELLEGENGEFERVLWSHLDEEVEFLKAENMRRFWGVEEVRRLPM
ncbi:uncharacterized protein BDV14DRAFT_203006 [Aspergillus stella-maris]|uniref:uncharacterized protein n=1 Tax=Aspergillus stella-maris TaxID=1810926 RepID=UPI003CCD804C